MVTLSPMVSPAGPPPCSTQLSSTLTLLPMRIGPKSALMTAPGQTVELGPISTSPMIVALMAMKQLGSILGVLPRKGQIIHNLRGWACAMVTRARLGVHLLDYRARMGLRGTRCSEARLIDHTPVVGYTRRTKANRAARIAPATIDIAAATNAAVPRPQRARRPSHHLRRLGATTALR